jgi:anti-sigma factor ChrR (cupin superfamily)
MRDAHLEDCDRIQEVLPEAILGALDADEAKAAVEHATTCAQCHDTLELNVGLVGQALLSDVDLEVEVPAGIKHRLMEKIKDVPQQKPGVRLDHDGLLILRSNKVPWQETGAPGLQWRPFSSSRYDNRTMAMFRLEAGGTIPGHRHEGVEELYILSGTLLVEGIAVNTGDYCRAEFDSAHAPVTALTNCEFLLCSDSITFP